MNEEKVSLFPNPNSRKAYQASGGLPLHPTDFCIRHRPALRRGFPFGAANPLAPRILAIVWRLAVGDDTPPISGSIQDALLGLVQASMAAPASARSALIRTAVARAG
jgi:hypothetical protein